MNPTTCAPLFAITQSPSVIGSASVPVNRSPDLFSFVVSVADV
jgi:hypothetical protein